MREMEIEEPVAPLNLRAGAFRNQPVGLPAFIGRENEISKIAELLRRPTTPLVTITGPAGVGKTHLALEAAKRCASQFEHGGVFVPLDTITDASEVHNQIARALQLQQGSVPVDPNKNDQAGHTLGGVVTKFLTGKKFLLLLDNVEQIANIGEAILQLLKLDPEGQDLKILLTSKWPIHLMNEHVHKVPLLELPEVDKPLSLAELLEYDAIKIFLAALEQKGSEFVIDDEQKAAQAVEFCLLADSLPLGIQLAVGHISRLGLPTVINKLLKDNLRIGSLDSNVPNRQKDMERAIAWSYNLLDEEERMLLRRLSVFRGGWTLDAAQQVCAVGASLDRDAIQDLIGELLEKSLVQDQEPGATDGMPRYQMLFAVRNYAREQLTLDPGEHEVLQAHASYYTEMAKQAQRGLQSSEHLEWLEQLSVEEHNLRAALDWYTSARQATQALQLTASLWTYWLKNGRFSEGAKWLKIALSLADKEIRIKPRADALVGAAALALQERRFADTEALLGESESTYKALGDEHGLAYTLMFKSALANATDQRGFAAQYIEESVSFLRNTPDTWGLAMALYYRGYAWEGNDTQFITRSTAGDKDTAAVSYEESQHLFSRVGDGWGVALPTIGLANLEYRNLRKEKAVPLYERGISLLREVKATGQLCYPLTSMGNIALLLGNFSYAKDLFTEALDIHKVLNNRYSLAYTYNGLGEIARHEKHYKEAEEHYKAALRWHRQLRTEYAEEGNREKELEIMFPEAWELHNLGAVSYFLEAPHAARTQEYYHAALSLFREIGFEPGTHEGMIACIGGLAAVASRTGKHDLAVILFAAADAQLSLRSPENKPVVWLQPTDRDQYNAMKADVIERTKKVDPNLWDAKRKVGRRLPLEDAVSLALGGKVLPTKASKSEFNLSPREIEVLRLRDRGLSTADIAEQLSITVDTVYTVERNVRKKSKVNKTANAIKLAKEQGILE